MTYDATMPSRPALKLVHSASEPAQPATQKVAKTEFLQCDCGSRDAIPVTTGATVKRGKAVGGTVQWLCAHCLMAGKRVVLL